MMAVRRAAAWSAASQYASFAIQFATSVIISRLYLLPADVGLFSIALAAAMMVAIFQDLGISRFVVGQPEMRDENLRDYAAVAVALGWLVAGCVALAALPLAVFYRQPALTGVVLIVAAGYVIMPLGIVPAAMLTRRLDFRALFLANAGSAFGGAAIAIACAAHGAGPAALAWGMLASALTRVCIVLGYHRILPRWPRNAAAIRPLVAFGSSSLVLAASGAVGMRSQDLIVGRLLGLSAVGLFTRASALAGQLSTLMVGAINGVFYPAFAHKREAGDDLAEPYLHLVACNTALNWAAAIALAIAAEPVVLLLYGPNWAEVAPLLRWTAIAEVFFVAVPLQMDVPILLGRIRTLVWINLLDTALTIGLLVLFALWGVEAAAISRIIAAALWFGIYIGYISRLLGLPLTRLAAVYAGSAIPAAICAIPLGAAQWFGWFGGKAMGFAPLLVLSAAGAMLWLLTVAALRHPAWSEIRLAIVAIPGLRASPAGA